MAKGIVVDFAGEAVAFDLTKIDRDKLYGRKSLEIVDAAGRPCAGAWLTRDGGTVVPAGGLAYVYVRPDFATVERGELQTIDAQGQPAPSFPSTLGVPQPLVGPVPAARVLDFTIESVYLLSPDSLEAGLLARLAAGEIFECPFAYRGGCTELSTAFLLGNEAGFFALVGCASGFDFVDRNETAPEPVATEADDEGEELDFSMM